jgi:MurNAc alpha-1-phosphate uridylyltransferase
MIVTDTAMIMAAGYGKRMRPLTATRPKPLVQVAGKAMIDHVYENLWNAGISKTVVNVHYLADALEAHLGGLKYPINVKISDEREALLETGGGMTKALPLIDADPFFCLNSDNIWLNGSRDVFQILSDDWDADKMDALLLLVPHKNAFHHNGRGDFHLDAEGRISWRKSGRVAPYIFTGIQLISKRLLRDAPDGAFSTRIFWDRAMEDGRLYGALHEGQWFDVGTPEAIAPTEAALLSG